MTPRISENVSSWSVGWSFAPIMGNTMPPRDPNDHDDAEDEDEDRTGRPRTGGRQVTRRRAVESCFRAASSFINKIAVHFGLRSRRVEKRRPTVLIGRCVYRELHRLIGLGNHLTSAHYDGAAVVRPDRLGLSLPKNWDRSAAASGNSIAVTECVIVRIAKADAARSRYTHTPTAQPSPSDRATNVETFGLYRPALKPRRRLPTAAHHTIPCAGLIIDPALGEGTSRSNAVFRVRRLRGLRKRPTRSRLGKAANRLPAPCVWAPRLTRGYCVPYAGSQLIRHPPKAAGTGLDRPQSGKAITASGIRPDSHWPCVLP